MFPRFRRLHRATVGFFATRSTMDHPMKSKCLFLLVGTLVAGSAWAAAPQPTPQARVAFERGERALAANQLDAAAAAYREALQTTPGYVPAINGLGSVYFKQGKKDDAIAQFKLAIENDPSFKLAWFNMGYAARK